MAGLGVSDGFPPLSKSLASALVVIGAACQIKKLGAALKLSLDLIPARAIPRPWTLLTCALLNDSIIGALAYAVAVLFLGRIVEPIYGGRELIKYLCFVVILTSFLTVAVVTILYYATVTAEKSSTEADHAGDVLFRPMGGFEAAAAALLVALKQLIPDNEVALLGGALKFRAKHLPGLYVALMVGGSLLVGGAVRVIPFVLFGTYLAWAYLRFVQTRNGVRGDLSEEFRLASFFPQPLQPPVDRAAGACTRVTGLGSAAGSQQHQAAWNYGLGMGGSALPGTEAGDAARRRERGAKALEERLGLKKAAGAGAGAGAASGAALLPQQQPAEGSASGGSQGAAGEVDVEAPPAGES